MIILFLRKIISKIWKIISIAIDDTKTNHHFGGQSLLGIVDSFVPCSDLPGPNMELLPSCNVSTVGMKYLVNRMRVWVYLLKAFYHIRESL